ncbi:MAG: hypothetical protein GX853_10320, partial [Chloroflexi bacterium]|nr:hypothetical protein [Chloroflexota bacterium]
GQGIKLTMRQRAIKLKVTNSRFFSSGILKQFKYAEIIADSLSFAGWVSDRQMTAPTTVAKSSAVNEKTLPGRRQAGS